jgi:DNA-binding transcriptional ArsR family regulator
MDTVPAEPRAAAIPTVSPAVLEVTSSFIDPVKLHAALGDKLRWRLVRELSDGSALTVRELARRLRADANLVTKHIGTLRKANVIERKREPLGDQRRRHYRVPPFTRRNAKAGERVVDYGCCVLRF